MERRFLRINELASTRDRAGRWPVAPATIWRWVAAGLLDAPVRLGPQVSAWPIDAIERFEAQQALVSAPKEQRIKAGVASVAARRAKRQAEAAPPDAAPAPAPLPARAKRRAQESQAGAEAAR